MKSSLKIINQIDIHTHRAKSDSSILIRNIFAQNLPIADENELFSTGLHPWHLDEVNVEECLHSIELASGQKNMLAVGECGLDRLNPTSFALQELYFRKQIEIAIKYSKPLIIHCVRAIPELIKLKKEYSSPIPWIIHGFYGNEPSARQLISHNFYFSVGQQLLTNHLKSEILSILPSDRIFFETDDRDLSISKIYLLASQILKINEESLRSIIYENFLTVFGNEFAVNNNLT